MFQASCSHGSCLTSSGSQHQAAHVNASGERVAFVCSGCGAARSPPPPYQQQQQMLHHSIGEHEAVDPTTRLVFYGELEQQQDVTSDSDYAHVVPPPSPTNTASNN